MKTPVEAVIPAFTVSGEEAVLPAGGVIGDGRINVTSDGATPTQETVNATAELKLCNERTVIIAPMLDP